MNVTWQNEEYTRNKSQDSALWPDVPDITDDKGGENKEQGNHWKGSCSPDHFWKKEEGGLETEGTYDRNKNDENLKFIKLVEMFQ